MHVVLMFKMCWMFSELKVGNCLSNSRPDVPVTALQDRAQGTKAAINSGKQLTTYDFVIHMGLSDILSCFVFSVALGKELASP